MKTSAQADGHQQGSAQTSLFSHASGPAKARSPHWTARLSLSNHPRRGLSPMLENRFRRDFRGFFWYNTA